VALLRPVQNADIIVIAKNKYFSPIINLSKNSPDTRLSEPLFSSIDAITFQKYYSWYSFCSIELAPSLALFCVVAKEAYKAIAHVPSELCTGYAGNS